MKRDILTLTFPAKAQYVLPLRLYISGVATRMDFAVDAIEDIKTAVSEACVLLLSDVTGGDMRICLEAGQNELEADFCLERPRYAGEAAAENSTELSQMILEAMAKDCRITGNDGRNTRIVMTFSKGSMG